MKKVGLLVVVVSMQVIACGHPEINAGKPVVTKGSAPGAPTGSATGSPGVTVTVVGGGTVTSNPSGINCGSACTLNVASGASLTLTAVPATGNVFYGWSGDCLGTGPAALAPISGLICTANFAADAWASSEVPSSGSVTLQGLAPISTGWLLGGLLANPSSSAGADNLWLAATDPNGIPQWSNSYTVGPNAVTATPPGTNTWLFPTSLGGAAIATTAGNVVSASSGNDTVLLVVNSAGTGLGALAIDSNLQNDNVANGRLDNGGTIWFAGATIPRGENTGTGYALEVDPNAAAVVLALDIASGEDGEAVSFSAVSSFDDLPVFIGNIQTGSGTAALVTELSSSGIMTWATELEPTGPGVVLQDVVLLPDQSVIAVGSGVGSAANAGYAICLSSANPPVVVWQQTYAATGVASTAFLHAELAADGNVIVESASSGSLMVAELAVATGAVVWQTELSPDSGSAVPIAMRTAPDGQVGLAANWGAATSAVNPLLAALLPTPLVNLAVSPFTATSTPFSTPTTIPALTPSVVESTPLAVTLQVIDLTAASKVLTLTTAQTVTTETATAVQ